MKRSWSQTKPAESLTEPEVWEVKRVTVEEMEPGEGFLSRSGCDVIAENPCSLQDCESVCICHLDAPVYVTLWEIYSIDSTRCHEPQPSIDYLTGQPDVPRRPPEPTGSNCLSLLATAKRQMMAAKGRRRIKKRFNKYRQTPTTEREKLFLGETVWLQIDQMFCSIHQRNKNSHRATNWHIIYTSR